MDLGPWFFFWKKLFIIFYSPEGTIVTCRAEGEGKEGKERKGKERKRKEGKDKRENGKGEEREEKKK